MRSPYGKSCAQSFLEQNVHNVMSYRYYYTLTPYLLGRKKITFVRKVLKKHFCLETFGKVRLVTSENQGSTKRKRKCIKVKQRETVGGHYTQKTITIIKLLVQGVLENSEAAAAYFHRLGESRVGVSGQHRHVNNR